MLHFGERGAVARAAGGVLDRDPQVASLRRRRRRRASTRRGIRSARVVQRRDLAGDANHAEAVGTVRGDLEIDHGIVVG